MAEPVRAKSPFAIYVRSGSIPAELRRDRLAACTIDVRCLRSPSVSYSQGCISRYRLDRRARALKRPCDPHYLIGDVADPLTEYCAFDALISPGQLHIAFHRRDLALQLASLFKRDCKLLLKLADIGVGLVDAAEASEAIMDV